MNLYDVLRALVNHAGMPETVANDCLKTVDEAERWNALGTTSKTMDVEGHNPVYPPMSNVCNLCGRTHGK